MKRVLEETLSPSTSARQEGTVQGALPGKTMIFYGAAFLLCILVSLAPLYRLVGVAAMHLPTNGLLVLWGSWLPVDLHLATNTRGSRFATDTIFFLACLGLAFVVYGLAAFYLHRQPKQGNYRDILRVIWLVMIIAGGIFVITPALLSHDLYAYTAYGRILAYYHTNPYFIPFSAFPQDAFAPYDDWKSIPSAYGPVWEVISGLAIRFIGNHLDRAIIIFRLLAFIPHIINTLLIGLILRKMRRSEHVVALGTLLYAWNPLVLEESYLNGHNDAFMMTLVLLGLFYMAQIEYKGIIRPDFKAYIGPILAFSLATLVKFSAAPILALYLIVLARKALIAQSSQDETVAVAWHSQVFTVLKTIIPAGLIILVIIVGLYMPYWFGFGIKDVVYTFSATPSSASSYGSMLFAMIKWVQAHDYPPTNSWSYPLVYLFSQHKTWSIINLIAITGMMIVGAIWTWRAPTTRTLVLSIVAMLGLILVVTYWFFPWYLTWTVSLAVLCLPAESRLKRALVAFTLVFSASALCFYLYASNLPPLGGWTWVSCATTLIPPVLTFVLFMLVPTRVNKIAEQS